VIGFAHPAWLLGLLLAPVIWYLHRSGPLLQRVPVASVELWRDATATASRSGRRPRPDPAWRRRAAIAVLLSLALASPDWRGAAPRVTVWIDDSLSMRSADASGSRLQQAVSLTQRALEAAGAEDVIARRLSEPTRQYDGLGDNALSARHADAQRSEPRLPPPESLDRSRTHWLVTDGADAAVNAWAATAPIARVLQTSGATRNVGVTRMSARLQPGDASTLAVQVRVLNGGSERESRTLELVAGTSRIEARKVELDAGRAATLEFVLATAPATPLGVRLLPGDALADDDALQIDLAPLAPLPVTVDAGCPAPVTRAVRAHPALRSSHVEAARLVIYCGGLPDARGAARIVLHQGAPTVLDASRLFWSPTAADLQRQLADHLPAAARGRLEPPRPGDIVLLGSGTSPLIVSRAGSPRRVESVLDIEAPGFATGPGLPLLVAALADVALGEPLLGRTASADRGDDSSRVVPLAVTAPLAQIAPAPVVAPLTILPLLLLALALLAWDTAALARQLARSRAVLRESAT
jgi:hypothetical protein